MHAVPRQLTVIGILGGIASGKSTVARLFAELGAVVFDADAVGHQVLQEPAVKQALAVRFGPGVLTSQGEIDRRALAARVFGTAPESAANLAYLESVSHPRIEAALTAHLAQVASGLPPRVAVIDAALLDKAGWRKFCNYLVFVKTGDAVRRQRALARGWTEEEFAQREALQGPLVLKQTMADEKIDGEASLETARDQVRALWSQWVDFRPA